MEFLFSSGSVPSVVFTAVANNATCSPRVEQRGGEVRTPLCPQEHLRQGRCASRRSAFSAEGELGSLDTGRFAVLELMRTKTFKSRKTKASLANKRSQNPVLRRGKKADFNIVSQAPTVSSHCGPQPNSVKDRVYNPSSPHTSHWLSKPSVNENKSIKRTMRNYR